ncbi:alpha-D-ribose 1-methylphosphonate 5-phosphate C-P-lyase PhnJ [Deinococcus koreensis]|uniref:Carbon-phosphorus lyase complex subunit PhnJ n=1 Tax=Deinococcus koreensis TaxID=2054903 RepID=A0A2K3UY27_9DEIO|nr:alpha-D-ribose 1-methylphosphonate 5-phosphate C-P-lyase PhnJ [Deinococcus koreensis]PNY81437.1 carbon-phosphorus lyase complex subunit PhnJ [Deinococcus koreensis]
MTGAVTGTVTGPVTGPVSAPTLAELAHPPQDHTYAFLDESAKRELRRTVLRAIALPGHQVPYASREVPIARGWGTGGLQATLALVGPQDTVKVIDQGADDSVNAANLRRFIARMTGVPTTTDATQATLIQSRHRVPEEVLGAGQVLVLQVPDPEPLRAVESDLSAARQLHADADYGLLWLGLFEQLIRYGWIIQGASYPALVHGRYVISPSPIPRWDVPKLHQAAHLTLLSAGREKRLYAVPPYTDVRPLQFDDVPYRVEDMNGKACVRTGAAHKFLNELPQEGGSSLHELSDAGYGETLLRGREDGQVRPGATYYDDEGGFYHDGYLAR